MVVKASLGEDRVRIKLVPPAGHWYKERCADLIDKINDIPANDGECARLKALAMTAVEEAMYWAVKAATYEHYHRNKDS